MCKTYTPNNTVIIANCVYREENNYKNFILQYTDCSIFAEGAASAEYLDPMLIATELRNPGAKEIYGLPTSSLIWKVLYSIKDNNTFGLLDRTANGSREHGMREFRNMPKENEKSRSTIRIDRNDDPRRKHPRNIRSRYSQILTR